MTDWTHILFPVSEELYRKLHARFDRYKDGGGQMSLDEFVEHAIGDEETWTAALASGREKVVTGSPTDDEVSSPEVVCACCLGVCRHQIVWRKKSRCACTADRVRQDIADRVVGA